MEPRRALVPLGAAVLVVVVASAAGATNLRLLGHADRSPVPSIGLSRFDVHPDVPTSVDRLAVGSKPANVENASTTARTDAPASTTATTVASDTSSSGAADTSAAPESEPESSEPASEQPADSDDPTTNAPARPPSVGRPRSSTATAPKPASTGASAAPAVDSTGTTAAPGTQAPDSTNQPDTTHRRRRRPGDYATTSTTRDDQRDD